jgi:hypothetical protein
MADLEGGEKTSRAGEGSRWTARERVALISAAALRVPLYTSDWRGSEVAQAVCERKVEEEGLSDDENAWPSRIERCRLDDNWIC